MQKQNIGDQAKRILQRMKGIFDYAVTHQLIEHSPASSLKADDIIRAKPKHHPAMPLEAMEQFFDDLDNSNASIVSKLALRLQILTGVRTHSVQ
jgi:integrase